MEPKTIHTRLKELRNSQNMSQTELARKLGVTPSYVSAMERGTKDITRKVVERLVELFQVSADWIMSTSDTNRTTPNRIPNSTNSGFQSDENSAFDPKNSQNNSYNNGIQSPNSSRIPLNKLYYFLQQRFGNKLPPEGHMEAYFGSIVGVYSDKVLAFLYLKFEAEIDKLLLRLAHGEITPEETANQIVEVCKPLSKLAPLIVAVENSIAVMMEVAAQEFPEVKDLLKDSGAAYIVDTNVSPASLSSKQMSRKLTVK